MNKLRIYIDTSVIGGCFDDEFAVWSNGLVDDFKLSYFRVVTSVIVRQEIEAAPVFIRKKFNEIMGFGGELLKVTGEVLDLYDFYRKRKILTVKSQNDMLHVALATVAKVDIIVSWNFKHIVRFDKIKQFNASNLEKGYKAVDIFSPREVTRYGKK